MARRRTTALATRVRNVYVRARRGRSSRNGGGIKIPLAVVAGFIPSTAWALDAGFQGNWQCFFERELASFTGYEWGQKKFTFMYLSKGLWPVLAGVVAHGVANRLGLNRAIRRMIPMLPIEI